MTEEQKNNIPQKANADEIITPAKLTSALQAADNILTKTYQYELTAYPVLPPSEALLNAEVTQYTRLFKVERIAYDKNEDNLAKLSNVYNAMSAAGGSVILIVDSDGEYIDFYIGTKTADESGVQVAFKTLEKAFNGNFPGCVLRRQVSKKISKTLNKLFEYRDEDSSESNRTISVVSGISSFRNHSGNKGKQEYTQGIEKLVDSMRGEAYSMILLADPVPQMQIDVIRNGYEQLYTKLVPFAGAEMSLGYTSGKTLTDSITKGVANTISESLTISQSHTESSSVTKTVTLGMTTGGSAGITGGVPGFSANASKFTSVNASTSKAKTYTKSDTVSEAQTKQNGTTKSFTTGTSEAISQGESRTMQIKTEEKSIGTLLERIDKQLKRLSECGDLGMWNCSAYFIADDLQTSKTAASTYQALIRGEDSGLEAITINTWSHNAEAPANYDNVSAYLKKLYHPVLYIGEGLPEVTPTALISGAELTIQAGLPQKSIPGLAVAHYAAFGREIQSQDEIYGSTIALGNVFHMGAEENAKVSIDKQSLTAHTLVTGSTGAGKSNAVYQILTELNRKGVKYLVVEPAKGEYKYIFGNDPEVHVYGTNPKKNKLLRINPFKFPADIHVLEHIDRLIEIFNVCWPMYAAMPAVLKDAVERAYTAVGWDLDDSENRYDPPRYPTFKDVLDKLPKVIDESAFSGELKGNYTGALVTRVNSLTNGLIGRIFVSNEIDNKILFDENTIVDLSRVNSAETKALIMGILVMRLQEHRVAEGGMNLPLRHITVLEEAHHLLKRTAVEYSSESSNLQGKSVEMLSQSIAEMRTYGEGFLIADQSPNMLDMSAIRNTNTKIILRLPDLADRELCGRAAGLNDEQVVELTKLPTGVAAVYQNNWIEPVLCKVNHFKSDETTRYQDTPETEIARESAIRRGVLQGLLAHTLGQSVDQNIDKVVGSLEELRISEENKQMIREVLQSGKREFADVYTAVDALWDAKDILASGKGAGDIAEWNAKLYERLGLNALQLTEEHQLLALQCVLRQKAETLPELKSMYSKWQNAMIEGVKG